MDKCSWEYRDCLESYLTSCNGTFTFLNAMLADNPDFKFCPYCGKEIEVQGKEK